MSLVDHVIERVRRGHRLSLHKAAPGHYLVELRHPLLRFVGMKSQILVTEQDGEQIKSAIRAGYARY